MDNNALKDWIFNALQNKMSAGIYTDNEIKGFSANLEEKIWRETTYYEFHFTCRNEGHSSEIIAIDDYVKFIVDYKDVGNRQLPIKSDLPLLNDNELTKLCANIFKKIQEPGKHELRKDGTFRLIQN